MTKLTYTTVTGRSHLPLVAYLKRWLPKALKLIPKLPAELSIVLLGNKRMAALHQEFLHLAGATDVLTFELERNARGRVTSGEIALCVPYAQREARRRRIKVQDELLLYALHGVLHLSGYDDLTPASYARMHREEDRILRQIGVGTIFKAAENFSTESFEKLSVLPIQKNQIRPA